MCFGNSMEEYLGGDSMQEVPWTRCLRGGTTEEAWVVFHDTRGHDPEELSYPLDIGVCQ